MDLIHGANLEQDLADTLALTGQLPSPQSVVQMACQVLDILIYLHSRKPPVIHRDIKPANMLREFGTGRIKLVDFGLALASPGKPIADSGGDSGLLTGGATPRPRRAPF